MELQKFRLEIAGVALEGHFNNTKTATSIAAACPIEIQLSRWGNEYYGNCDVITESEPATREAMKIGEIAFWPPGSALCIFFGATPASIGTEPRAASPVHPLGSIHGETSAIIKALSPLPSTVKARLMLTS